MAPGSIRMSLFRKTSTSPEAADTPALLPPVKPWLDWSATTRTDGNDEATSSRDPSVEPLSTQDDLEEVARVVARQYRPKTRLDVFAAVPVDDDDRDTGVTAFRFGRRFGPARRLAPIRHRRSLLGGLRPPAERSAGGHSRSEGARSRRSSSANSGTSVAASSAGQTRLRVSRGASKRNAAAVQRRGVESTNRSARCACSASIAPSLAADSTLNAVTSGIPNVEECAGRRPERIGFRTVPGASCRPHLRRAAGGDHARRQVAEFADRPEPFVQAAQRREQAPVDRPEPTASGYRRRERETVNCGGDQRLHRRQLPPHSRFSNDEGRARGTPRGPVDQRGRAGGCIGGLAGFDDLSRRIT